ncbi:MAG: dTMP kinase [Myxococcales bacterium]|nr:dTMP kinase [Myxococcales bacterium]MCB9521002.1 dTMP kinase [Myxococcales bacterium]MCB9531671.1 dTMP kinase [Myxococcales bacterium]MCB9534006.1 dTMP kinase [Myxococcales bacterium]
MFVVLEGLDGAGTTTQLGLLVQRLRSAGHTALATREPSDGPIGVAIRQALRRRLVGAAGAPLSAETLALLFAADRVDHVVEEVEPALRAGRFVVCDRYVHSSIAYQGASLDPAWVAEINRSARVADVVYFVDTPVEVCVTRMAARGGAAELFERADTLAAALTRYEDAFRLRDEPVVRIAGDRPVAEVADAIWSDLSSRIQG